MCRTWYIDPSFRISIWPVVTNCHYMTKERFSIFETFICFIKYNSKHILISNTPRRFVMHPGGRHISLIYYLVTIMAKEISHVIEKTVPTINEFYVISLLFQHTS